MAGPNAVTGNGPDQSAALRKYERAAPGYDRHMRTFARWQRRAVEALELQEGEAVTDVACGTGLNFPLLEAGIGSSGRIIGIDLSPEMLAQARERVAAHGRGNVTLIEAAVEEAAIDASADGALFSFTHDVLQSTRAVANIVSHLRPGGRVATVGPKFAGRWNVLVNAAVRRSARPYVTTFRGLDRPWRELERYTEGMRIHSLALGGAYVGWGRVSGEGPARARRLYAE